MNEDKKECMDCPNKVWFGDYMLWYCNIDRGIIEKGDVCHLDEMDLKPRR